MDSWCCSRLERPHISGCRVLYQHVVGQIVSGIYIASARPALQRTSSRNALLWAIRHLYRTGDKFHLLHVIPEPDTLHPQVGIYIPPDDAQEREEFRDAIAMVRAAFAPPLQDAKVPAVVHLIVAPDNTDSIANIILDAAEDLPAAALVMASHGKQGLVEFWMGSVTRRVMRLTPVPVTICPAAVQG